MVHLFVADHKTGGFLNVRIELAFAGPNQVPHLKAADKTYASDLDTDNLGTFRPNRAKTGVPTHSQAWPAATKARSPFSSLHRTDSF